MKYNKYLIIALLLFLLTRFSACDIDKPYEVEMYKHVFALVSSDNFNIRQLEHDLENIEETAYISISCGGTRTTDKDLTIYLKWDKESFDQYNLANFLDENKYAKLVPEANYTLNDYVLTLPAGSRDAHLQFIIRPEGLSPDSTYFIPLAVDRYTEFEINPDKAYVMYRPVLKNFWAQQSVTTNYRLRGVYNGNDNIGTKRLFPLTHNRVRTTIGNITSFTSDTASINAQSMVIEVEKARGEKLALEKRYPVTVSPLKHVTVLPPLAFDPDFPNIFFIEFDGFKTFKTFLLNYRYMLPGSTTVHTMKEELRLEFVFEND